MNTRCPTCGKVPSGGDVVARGEQVFCNQLCRYSYEKGKRAQSLSTPEQPVRAAEGVVSSADSEHYRRGKLLQNMGQVGWIAAAVGTAGNVFAMFVIWYRTPVAPSPAAMLALLSLYFSQLLACAFMTYGLWSMSRFQSYGLALSASAFAMLPWLGCCMMLQIPLAVICFLRLAEPGATALFPPRTLRPIPQQLPRYAALLAPIGLVLFPVGLIAAALGVWVIAHADRNLDARSRTLAVRAVWGGIAACAVSFLSLPLVLMALGLFER